MGGVTTKSPATGGTSGSSTRPGTSNQLVTDGTTVAPNTRSLTTAPLDGTSLTGSASNSGETMTSFGSTDITSVDDPSTFPTRQTNFATNQQQTTGFDLNLPEGTEFPEIGTDFNLPAFGQTTEQTFSPEISNTDFNFGSNEFTTAQPGSTGFNNQRTVAINAATEETAFPAGTNFPEIETDFGNFGQASSAPGTDGSNFASAGPTQDPATAGTSFGSSDSPFPAATGETATNGFSNTFGTGATTAPNNFGSSQPSGSTDMTGSSQVQTGGTGTTFPDYGDYGDATTGVNFGTVGTTMPSFGQDMTGSTSFNNFQDFPTGTAAGVGVFERDLLLLIEIEYPHY